MMNHTYVLALLADETRADLLREADSQRLALRAEKSHLKPASPLKQITRTIHGLLRVHFFLLAEPNLVSTKRESFQSKVTGDGVIG